MLFILNKNKIISYTIAASVVMILFVFSISFVPNKDVELIPISSNATNNIISNEIQNNNLKNDNNYN